MNTTRHPLVRFVRKHNVTGGGGGYPALGICVTLCLVVFCFVLLLGVCCLLCVCLCLAVCSFACAV